jgi:hypothetical protein
MKVDAALASYPQPVTLREPQWIRWADIAGALAALAIAYKIGTGHVACPPLGLFLALAAALILVLAVRDLRKPSSLTLSVNGFQVRDRKEEVTVPWSYVQHFREVGDEEFVVGFDLVNPEGAMSPARGIRFPDSFGLDGPDLLAVLTKWHAMSLGLHHRR